MCYKIFLPFILLSFTTFIHSLPLSTSSRWIIDDSTGSRVKLTCVNWAAHLEPMLPEGLDKRPVAEIARHVALMGFNCVRLTWATYMFTRFANMTVQQSFSKLGLYGAIEGITQNNPGILNLTVVEAQKAVIDGLGLNGVMVELDNQVSQPMWCCGDNDGNGFFGDKYFDAEEWLNGLTIVANRYKDTSTVVAMSTRNELRGRLQNESVWYENIERGANAIHEANPNVIVVISGLDYDLDFTFLKQKPLNVSFEGKIVYEVHRYAFTSGQRTQWLSKPFNSFCENIIQDIYNKSGFLVEGENAAPLYVSEFGINQVLMDPAEHVFFGCYLGYLADMDLDWSLWALQGSYYLRDGLHGPQETYGLLDANWTSLKNPELYQKLQLIQHKIQDPNLKEPSYYIMYHPWSGQCIQAENSKLHADHCWTFSRWNHTGNGNPINLMGTDLCLSAVGDEMPVTLTMNCTTQQTEWEFVSDSNFQLASKDENGTYLCLDWDQNYSSKILTKKCMCLGNDDPISCQKDTQNQWFKFILANFQNDVSNDF